MKTTNRRGNLTLANITSLFLLIVILSGCTSAGNVSVVTATESSSPTAIPTATETLTATPNSLEFRVDGKTLTATQRHDLGNGAVIMEVGKDIYYSANDSDWQKMENGVIKIDEHIFKWNEKNKLERIFTSWQELPETNMDNPGIQKFLNGQQYEATVPGGVVEPNYVITWQAPEWWGSADWLSFAVNNYGDGNTQGRKFYQNTANVLYSKNLAKVSVGGGEVYIAQGITTYHKDESGKLLPVKVATPLAIIVDGGFSLFEPLTTYNFRTSAKIESFEELQGFWNSMSDSDGNVRSINEFGMAVDKDSGKFDVDAYMMSVKMNLDFCSVAVNPESCRSGVNPVLIKTFLENVAQGGQLDLPASNDENVLVSFMNQSPIGIFAQLGLVK